MMIGILTSEPGCGKSYAGLQWEEPIVSFDMENRLDEKIVRFFKGKQITNVPLMKYDKEYNIDEIASFEAFVAEVKKLPGRKPLPKTIFIDGIGELRDYASAKWAKVNNRKKASNPGDWEQINNMVRDVLFPMINWSRHLKLTQNYDINLIFTSQLKDDYTVIERDGKKESTKCGRIASHKDWISYNVDLLVDLWMPCGKNGKPDGRYMASVIKSPIGVFEVDLTPVRTENGVIEVSLYEKLLEKGL